VTACNTKAGIFWELPLGHASIAKRISPTKQQRETDSGEWSHTATRSNPNDPGNPMHPDEPSVLDARPVNALLTNPEMTTSTRDLISPR
jgi:hypothetical protein